jgi:hypothetical protein
MPIKTANNDDARDRFLGRSSLLKALPSLREPSPKAPAVILIAAMVPMQYENKNDNADFQLVIAKAGARELGLG